MDIDDILLYNKKKKKISKFKIFVATYLILGMGYSLSNIQTVREKEVMSNKILDFNKTISIKGLKKCYLIKIQDINTKINEFHICRKITSSLDKKDYYNDLLNGETVYIFDNKKNDNKMVSEILLDDYLNEYSDLKEEYTFKEIQNLLDEMKKNFNEENRVFVKTLVKSNDVLKVN